MKKSTQKRLIKWAIILIAIVLASYGLYKLYHLIVDHITGRITAGVAKGVRKGAGGIFRGIF